MTEDLHRQLVNRETKLSLIGLGYVGMPIAVAFAGKVDVIGRRLDLRLLAFEEGHDAAEAFVERVGADKAGYDADRHRNQLGSALAEA